MNAVHVQNAQKEVARRERLRRIRHVPPSFELTRCAAHQNVRHVIVKVLIGVAHVGPIQDQRVIQQGLAVSFLRSLQLVQVIRETLDVILIDVRIPLDIPRIFGMVRGPMEWAVDSAFGIRPRGQIARIEKR